MGIQNKEKTLNIATNFYCNQKCVFCTDYDKSGLSFLKKEIDIEVFKAIMYGYKNYEKIIFTSGEPTLNKSLFRYIKIAKMLGYKNIGLITNGSTLKNESIRIGILNSGLTEITVSIHGIKSSVHDSLTGIKGQFNNTMEGLLLLLKEKGNILVQISYVLNKLNLSILYQSIIYFYKLGINRIIVNTMRPEGYGKFRMKDLSIKYSQVVTSYNDLDNEQKNIINNLIIKNNLNIMDIPVCILSDIGKISEKMYGKVEIRATNVDTKIIHDEDTFNEKKYINECLKCRYYKKCEGIYDKYLEIYGDKEFKAII